MKKILFTLVMAVTSAISFAQDYGKYSMQNFSSESDFQQYVGQRVKVMSFKSRYEIPIIDEGRDEYLFQYHYDGSLDTPYTIEKIKVGKQISIDLISESGSKVKVKVRTDYFDNKGMKTCKSFFLVDKFEADRQKMIGKTINNSESQPVAKIIDVQMTEIVASYPQPRIVIQSNFDDSQIICTEEEANVLCSNLGKILTHPKVKHQYKVVGVCMPKQEECYNPEDVLYNLQDPESPNEKHVCKFKNNLIDSAFKEDLKGHYISVLSKVEKPSNPAIRYGKTTVVEDENVSKYSYIDNAIDILIFGGSKQFDFILKNVSENSIKIIWNEAVFVGFDGMTSKVMHVGTKFSQREADQPATTIIKGAKIEDIAIPNCNIRYSDVLKEWVTNPMYPKSPALSPGQLQLMLPIQIKDVVNEYIFVFDVNYVYDHPEKINL